MFERQLARPTARRIVAELDERVGSARAEQCLRRALAEEGAAALGRQIERTRDLGAVPAVELLKAGHHRRVVAAARRAAALDLPPVHPGETLRASWR